MNDNEPDERTLTTLGDPETIFGYAMVVVLFLAGRFLG